MGIQGLLQILKPAHQERHISEMKGQTAAIDIMTWLYKGAFAFSYELGTNQQTLGFLSFPMRMLKIFQSYDIKPICVFDGQKLQAKAETEKTRSLNKRSSKEIALKMEEDGNNEEARKYFGRSLVLKTKMIDLFIDILQKLNIPFIIAPYEADAQLAYLVKEGIADFAVTEDSDLITYGCPNVFTKLSTGGYGQYFSMEEFSKMKDIQDKGLLFLQSLNREQFVQCCIMAGCEYLPSIPRVGLKIAIKYMQKFGTVEKVIEQFINKKSDQVPENYIEKLFQVQQLFFYQTVYDPRTKQQVSLGKITKGVVVDKIYLGEHIPKKILSDYVNGVIDKFSKQQRKDYSKVIDFKRMVEDFEMNNISERSFVCLDNKFYDSPIKREEGKVNGVERPKRVLMDADEFGFYDSDGSDNTFKKQSTKCSNEEMKEQVLSISQQDEEAQFEQLNIFCNELQNVVSKENHKSSKEDQKINISKKSKNVQVIVQKTSIQVNNNRAQIEVTQQPIIQQSAKPKTRQSVASSGKKGNNKRKYSEISRIEMSNKKIDQFFRKKLKMAEDQ